MFDVRWEMLPMSKSHIVSGYFPATSPQVGRRYPRQGVLRYLPLPNIRSALIPKELRFLAGSSLPRKMDAR